MVLYNGGRNEMCVRGHSEVNKNVRQKNAVLDFLLGLARTLPSNEVGNVAFLC